MELDLRKQYHFRKSPNGFYAWDVHRLVELSAKLPVFEKPLAEIQEIDEPYWFGSEENQPTCRAIIDHMKLVEEADLQYPIILCAEGRLMDGMHRIGKALLRGEETVRAVQFEKTPEPDFIDVTPDELDY